jgi:hypothetical protein
MPRTPPLGNPRSQAPRCRMQPCAPPPTPHPHLCHVQRKQRNKTRVWAPWCFTLFSMHVAGGGRPPRPPAGAPGRGGRARAGGVSPGGGRVRKSVGAGRKFQQHGGRRGGRGRAPPARQAAANSCQCGGACRPECVQEVERNRDGGCGKRARRARGGARAARTQGSSRGHKRKGVTPGGRDQSPEAKRRPRGGPAPPARGVQGAPAVQGGGTPSGTGAAAGGGAR